MNRIKSVLWAAGVSLALAFTVSCSGDDGSDGMNGEPGAAGTNGKNGKDGADGVDGEPGVAGADGKDGTNGVDGAPGANGANGANGTNGTDGADGIGCTVAVDDDPAYLVMTCGNTMQKWPKAMCGAAAYDPETHRCEGLTLKGFCNEMPYDIEEKLCCNGEIYDIDDYACPGGNLSLIDHRDDQRYRIAKIGEQTWLAENMNYAGEAGSEIGACYGDSDANCNTYGRLYAWAEATDNLCPTGWKLPSKEDFEELIAEVENNADELKTGDFAAKLGGYKNMTIFTDISIRARFWSSTEYEDENVYPLDISTSINMTPRYRIHMYSVRCLESN